MSARKVKIADAFGRAEAYDAHAHIQRVAAERLAASIAGLNLTAGRPALEIGCGTGFLTAALLQAHPGLNLTATDIAPAMIARARARLGPRPGLSFAQLDGENPGDAPPGGWGLIASSLAFQWFEQPRATIAALVAQLAPGGVLALTTLCAGSFAEWRDALASAGLDGVVRDWPDEAALGALCPPEARIDIACYPLVEPHASGLAFLRGLRAIGAATPWQRGATATGLRQAIATFEAKGAQVTYCIAELLVRRP